MKPGSAGLAAGKVPAGIVLAFIVTLVLPKAGLAGSAPEPEYAFDAKARKTIALQKWKTHPGDDTAWAAPDWPDQDWEKTEKAGTLWLESGYAVRGVRWYRTRILVSSETDSLDPLYIHAFQNPNAQEIYWDGVLMASNGHVAADMRDEKSGRIFVSVRIPWKAARPGTHVLAMRISNQIQFTGGIGELMLGTWKPLQNAFHGPLAMMVFLVGIFFIAGIYYFLNFLNRIQPTYALFSLFCMGCTLETIPIVAAAYNNVLMDTFLRAVAVQTIGWTVMMTSLPLFFLSEFSSVPKKWFFAVGLAVAAITVPQIMTLFLAMPAGIFKLVSKGNDVLGFAAVGVSLGVTAWAVYRKKEGSLMASLGLVCLMAGVAWGEVFQVSYAWALGLTALILFLNASLTRRLTRQSMAYQENHLKGARLEIELLKKNIQPHFLLTSLRSITDWLEKEPKMAARLVNALATELRMMLKMSSERSIPLTEEIKLCRTHLEVMGLRRHRALELATHGVGGEELIPPMVMHTLLEMGLEEAEDGDGEIRFLLERRLGDGLSLRLSHTSSLKPKWQRGTDDTGLKYVRARLEEAFPKRWTLRVGPSAVGSTWQAEVHISDSAALAGAHSMLPIRSADSA